MSYFDYLDGQRVSAMDCTFYGIIQAAMRRADDNNLDRLQRAFPEVWDELRRRYNSPGGALPGESVADLFRRVEQELDADREQRPC